MSLGWNDIKSRYRRTVLGPFWIVLNTMISIGFLGFVYKTIFKMAIGDFLPFIAAGIIIWNLIFANISESCLAFIQQKYLLQGIPIRPELIIVRLVFRNTIIFFHNLIVVIIILFIFGYGLNLNFLLAIPGMIFIFILSFSVGIILAYLSARFRDLPQMVSSLMGIMFLITPIIWPKRLLGENQIIAIINPFTHMITMIREPLLGNPVPLLSWIVVIMIAFMMSMLAFVVSRSFRYRLMYWL
ncbi:MAG: ABC transporter permease [Candidatus Aminicenantes bacterium]|nr:ABC transporter permease [Candidatus Aminicenantes bacterium]MCK5003546.1 ABC transporter permease [Candidatus Aminicenantes bacterium]